MSKAVLVIDMPESCSKCKFMYEFYGVKKCHLLNLLGNGGKAILTKDEFTKGRVEKCPLVPIPEKNIECTFKSCSKGCCTVGWNSCIDAICGGEEETVN